MYSTYVKKAELECLLQQAFINPPLLSEGQQLSFRRVLSRDGWQLFNILEIFFIRKRD